MPDLLPNKFAEEVPRLLLREVHVFARRLFVLLPMHTQVAVPVPTRKVDLAIGREVASVQVRGAPAAGRHGSTGSRRILRFDNRSLSSLFLEVEVVERACRFACRVLAEAHAARVTSGKTRSRMRAESRFVRAERPGAFAQDIVRWRRGIVLLYSWARRALVVGLGVGKDSRGGFADGAVPLVSGEG